MTAKVTIHTIYIATCQECGTHVSSSREIMARNSAYKHNIEHHCHCEATVNISGNTYTCAHGRQHKGKHVFENDEMYVVW